MNMPVTKSKSCEGACSTPVEEICTQPVVTVPQYLTMDRAVCEMASRHISALVVVDETDHFIGLLTATDMVRYYARQSNLCDAELAAAESRIRTADEPAWDFDTFPVDSVIRHMTRTVQTIPAGTTVAKAREMMRLQKIHHLLLLDVRDRPAGILSSLDLL